MVTSEFCLVSLLVIIVIDLYCFMIFEYYFLLYRILGFYSQSFIAFLAKRLFH